jgi:hypothetical protein
MTAPTMQQLYEENVALKANVEAKTGGPNGRPANKGKTPGKNTQKEEDIADETRRGSKVARNDDIADDEDDEDSSGTSAKDRWNQAVRAKMREVGISRSAATRAVVRENPKLQKEYVDEARAKRK